MLDALKLLGVVLKYKGRRRGARLLVCPSCFGEGVNALASRKTHGETRLAAAGRVRVGGGRAALAERQARRVEPGLAPAGCERRGGV